MGSLYGLNDITHVGFYEIPILSNIPGLVYLAPTCWEEYLAMMKWGIRQEKYPVAIRVPSGAVNHSDESFEEDYSRLNRFSTTRHGSGVAIIGVGACHSLALHTADMLKEKKGISATVINPRYLSGIDVEALDLLKNDHHTVITLEDGVIEGGFGEKIARYYGADRMRVFVHGIKKGLYDRYDYAQMARDSRLTLEQIIEDVE